MLAWLPKLLQMMPAVALAAGVAYAAHWYQVNQLQGQLDTVTAQNQNLRDQNTVLKNSAETTAQTVRELENQIRTQQSQIAELHANLGNIATERDRYMEIFARHDLQRLALARPGLIENRINSGTQQVLEELEAQSQP